MLKRLKKKDLVSYEKYGKITLTEKGRGLAVEIVRKHRLWETFLYEKLNFTWDEVHEVAEQLEHIKSAKLTEQLEKLSLIHIYCLNHIGDDGKTGENSRCV